MWSVIVFALEGPMPILTRGDATMAGPFEMIGRHLWLTRQRCSGVDTGPRGDAIARFNKCVIAAVGIGQCLFGKGDELVDIKLVVGEQHIVLEMIR